MFEKVKHTPVLLGDIFPLIYVKRWQAYLGLDSFSQKSFIKTKLAKSLNLKIFNKSAKLHINGFGNSNENSVHSVSSQYCLLKLGGGITIELNLVSQIAPELPAVNVNVKEIWKEMNHEKLSCDFPRPTCQIDILLGLNTFLKCIKQNGSDHGI